MDPDGGLGAHGHVEVGTAEVEHPLQQVVEVQLLHDAQVVDGGKLRSGTGPCTGGRLGARRRAVHGVHHPFQLAAHGHGTDHAPTGGGGQLGDGIGVSRIAHGDEQVGAQVVDGDGQVTVGQLGGQGAVELGGHDVLREVDARLPHLGGHGGEEVLLPHQALGHQDGGQRPVLGRLPLQGGLQGLAGEDLALHQELTEAT